MVLLLYVWRFSLLFFSTFCSLRIRSFVRSFCWRYYNCYWNARATIPHENSRKIRFRLGPSPRRSVETARTSVKPVAKRRLRLPAFALGVCVLASYTPLSSVVVMRNGRSDWPPSSTDYNLAHTHGRARNMSKTSNSAASGSSSSSSSHMPTVAVAPAEDNFDFLFKIVLIGDCGTGKTCVVQRFKSGTYAENQGNTIGVDFSMKTIKIDGKKVKVVSSVRIIVSSVRTS